VLRCAVASLDSRQGVQYRGALRFDHRCDVLWEAITLDGYLMPAAESATAAAPGQSLPTQPEFTDDSRRTNTE
jgi:hypothetical protein